MLGRVVLLITHPTGERRASGFYVPGQRLAMHRVRDGADTRAPGSVPQGPIYITCLPTSYVSAYTSLLSFPVPLAVNGALEWVVGRHSWLILREPATSSSSGRGASRDNVDVHEGMLLDSIDICTRVGKARGQTNQVIEGDSGVRLIGEPGRLVHGVSLGSRDLGGGGTSTREEGFSHDLYMYAGCLDEETSKKGRKKAGHSVTTEVRPSGRRRAAGARDKTVFEDDCRRLQRGRRCYI